MKQLIFTFVCFLFLGACTTQKPLYTWDNYNESSYNYLKNADDASLQALVETYDKLINNPNKGTRGVIPPGVYADYGFILLQLNQTAKGKEMLMQEAKLYPESEVFIKRVLKSLE